MRGPAVARAGALAGLLWVGCAALAGAQEPPPAQEPPTETELVFEREIFSYPLFFRRNPFQPLVAAVSGGPRFDQLRLMGIIYSNDPGASIAIVSTSGLTISEDGTTVVVTEGDSWYLRRGQTMGNITILEIHPDSVVVDLEEFGLTERKTMTIQTRRLGGTP